MVVLYCNDFGFDYLASGASLYYREASSLLGSKPGDCRSHGFKDLLAGKSGIENLKSSDSVVSLIGPYAWYYYYLRKKHDLDFNIIHESQTGLLGDYLLQQLLCNDLMNEEDKVFFLSGYQRNLYLHLFPDILNESNTFVCNPLVSFFPKRQKRGFVKKEDDGFLVIGYLGRVFDPKNFSDVLKVFVSLNKKNQGIKLYVMGSADIIYSSVNVRRLLVKEGIDPLNYVHFNDGLFVDHSSVWDFLSKIDVLLFPSTANFESLGRVVLEACHANVPVIAASHAAMPDLLPKKNIVSVAYKQGVFDLNSAFAMGVLDIQEIENLLLGNKTKATRAPLKYYAGHEKKFFDILSGKLSSEKVQKSDYCNDLFSRINVDLGFNASGPKLSAAVNFLNQNKNADIVRSILGLYSSLNYSPRMTLH